MKLTVKYYTHSFVKNSNSFNLIWSSRNLMSLGIKMLECMNALMNFIFGILLNSLTTYSFTKFFYECPFFAILSFKNKRFQCIR